MTPARAVARPQAARAGSTAQARVASSGNGVPVTANAVATRAGRSWTTVLDGKRLRQLRREHGLSQEQLADRAAHQPDYRGQAGTADRRHHAAGGHWPGSPPRSTSSLPRSARPHLRAEPKHRHHRELMRPPGCGQHQAAGGDCQQIVGTLCRCLPTSMTGSLHEVTWPCAAGPRQPPHRRTRRAPARDARRRKREGIGTCAAHRGQPHAPRPPLCRPSASGDGFTNAAREGVTPYLYSGLRPCLAGGKPAVPVPRYYRGAARW